MKKLYFLSIFYLSIIGAAHAQTFSSAPLLSCGTSTTTAATSINLNTGYSANRTTQLSDGSNDALWQVREGNGSWMPALAKGLPLLNGSAPWATLPDSAWISGRMTTGPNNTNILFAAGFGIDSSIDINSIQVSYNALVDDELNAISFNGGTQYDATQLNVSAPLASGFSTPVSQNFSLSAITPTPPVLNLGSNYITIHARNKGWNYGLNMALKITANCANYASASTATPVPVNSWWSLAALGSVIGIFVIMRNKRRHQ